MSDLATLRELVARANPLVERLLAIAPGWNIPRSVIAQLRQIAADAEANRPPDDSMLERINIGLYAVREFETSDPELADLLIEIANRYEDWGRSSRTAR